MCSENIASIIATVLVILDWVCVLLSNFACYLGCHYTWLPIYYVILSNVLSSRAIVVIKILCARIDIVTDPPWLNSLTVVLVKATLLRLLLLRVKLSQIAPNELFILHLSLQFLLWALYVKHPIIINIINLRLFDLLLKLLDLVLFGFVFLLLKVDPHGQFLVLLLLPGHLLSQVSNLIVKLILFVLKL